MSLDMVEVNPSVDPDSKQNHGPDETVELGLQLIASALGNRII